MCDAVGSHRIGEEDGVKLGGLGDAGDADLMLYFHEAARIIFRDAPASRSKALQPCIDIEVQLFRRNCFHHVHRANAMPSCP